MGHVNPQIPILTLVDLAESNLRIVTHSNSIPSCFVGFFSDLNSYFKILIFYPPSYNSRSYNTMLLPPNHN